MITVHESIRCKYKDCEKLSIIGYDYCRKHKAFMDLAHFTKNGYPIPNEIYANFLEYWGKK